MLFHGPRVDDPRNVHDCEEQAGSSVNEGIRAIARVGTLPSSDILSLPEAIVRPCSESGGFRYYCVFGPACVESCRRQSSAALL